MATANVGTYIEGQIAFADDVNVSVKSSTVIKMGKSSDAIVAKQLDREPTDSALYNILCPIGIVGNYGHKFSFTSGGPQILGRETRLDSDASRHGTLRTIGKSYGGGSDSSSSTSAYLMDNNNNRYNVLTNDHKIIVYKLSDQNKLIAAVDSTGQRSVNIPFKIQGCVCLSADNVLVPGATFNSDPVNHVIKAGSYWHLKEDIIVSPTTTIDELLQDENNFVAIYIATGSTDIESEGILSERWIPIPNSTPLQWTVDTNYNSASPLILNSPQVRLGFTQKANEKYVAWNIPDWSTLTAVNSSDINPSRFHALCRQDIPALIVDALSSSTEYIISDMQSIHSTYASNMLLIRGYSLPPLAANSADENDDRYASDVIIMHTDQRAHIEEVSLGTYEATFLSLAGRTIAEYPFELEADATTTMAAISGVPMQDSRIVARSLPSYPGILTGPSSTNAGLRNYESYVLRFDGRVYCLSNKEDGKRSGIIYTSGATADRVDVPDGTTNTRMIKLMRGIWFDKKNVFAQNAAATVTFDDTYDATLYHPALNGGAITTHVSSNPPGLITRYSDVVFRPTPVDPNAPSVPLSNEVFDAVEIDPTLINGIFSRRQVFDAYAYICLRMNEWFIFSGLDRDPNPELAGPKDLCIADVDMQATPSGLVMQLKWGEITNVADEFRLLDITTIPIIVESITTTPSEIERPPFVIRPRDINCNQIIKTFLQESEVQAFNGMLGSLFTKTVRLSKKNVSDTIYEIGFGSFDTFGDMPWCTTELILYMLACSYNGQSNVVCHLQQDPSPPTDDPIVTVPIVTDPNIPNPGNDNDGDNINFTEFVDIPEPLTTTRNIQYLLSVSNNTHAGQLNPLKGFSTDTTVKSSGIITTNQKFYTVPKPLVPNPGEITPPAIRLIDYDQIRNLLLKVHTVISKNLTVNVHHAADSDAEFPFAMTAWTMDYIDQAFMKNRLGEDIKGKVMDVTFGLMYDNVQTYPIITALGETGSGEYAETMNGSTYMNAFNKYNKKKQDAFDLQVTKYIAYLAAKAAYDADPLNLVAPAVVEEPIPFDPIYPDTATVAERQMVIEKELEMVIIESRIANDYLPVPSPLRFAVTVRLREKSTIKGQFAFEKADFEYNLADYGMPGTYTGPAFSIPTDEYLASSTGLSNPSAQLIRVMLKGTMEELSALRDSDVTLRDELVS